jgi:thiol-disulfide isomerase/thioredoxin
MVTQRRIPWAAMAGAALGFAAAAMPAQVKPGDPFPALDPAALTGATLPETSGKVVFIDFWASWCAPCKASFPVYSQLYADYSGRGLVIIAVSVDDSPAAYGAFLAKMRPAFATVEDAQHRLVGAVQVPTMPTCYLVDRTGRVRFMHAGFHGGQTEHELRGEIERLLSEGIPAP